MGRFKRRVPLPSHCLYLVLNTQETRHYTDNGFILKKNNNFKKNVKKCHQPFQSFPLYDHADSAKKLVRPDQVAGTNSERACGINFSSIYFPFLFTFLTFNQSWNGLSLWYSGRTRYKQCAFKTFSSEFYAVLSWVIQSSSNLSNTKALYILLR